MKLHSFAFVVFAAVLLTISISAQTSLAQGCTEEAPGLSIFPSSIEAFPGKTISFEISLTNRDTRECTARNFDISVVVEGMNFFLRPTSLTIPPQETSRALLDVNIPANATAGPHQASVKILFEGNVVRIVTADINVVEEPTTCRISVDKIDTIEDGTNKVRTEFFENDKVRVRAEVSLAGGRSMSGDEVTVNLLVDGKVFDSKKIFILRNTFKEFFFDRIIDPQLLDASSADVAVEAKAACDVEGDKLSKRIRFKQLEDVCEFSGFVSTPSAATPSNILSSVLIKNRGTIENVIHYETFVCDEDIENCREMSCDVANNIRMEGGNFTSFFCRGNVEQTGDYKIKLELLACGDLIEETSDLFKVREGVGVTGGVCQEKFLDSYRCFGNVRQIAFQNRDCSIEYSDVEYCPFSCSDGVCSEAPADVFRVGGRPEIRANTEYTVQTCEVPSTISFELKNTGDTDIFGIGLSGDAAEWTTVQNKIEIKKGETKTVSAAVLIPCEVEEGDYDLKISAKSSSLQTVASSSVSFSGRAPSIVGGNQIDAVFIGIAVAILMGLIYVGYRKFAK